MEHHCEKLTQADSSSSIFPLKLENYLRYSGSEPLHNEHRSKQCSARELNTKPSKASFFQPILAKANMLRHQYSSNGDKKSRESVVSQSKDNQTKFSYNNLNNNNQSVCSNSNNNAKNKSTESFINNLRHDHCKRKHMTASETDFLRMRNTICIGGSGNGGNGGGTSSSDSNDSQKHNQGHHHHHQHHQHPIIGKHRLKQNKYNLIYALSDSDFLSWNFRQNEYSKITNLNQNSGIKSMGENNEAIFNRAELLKVILGKGVGSPGTYTTTTDYCNLAKLRTPSFDAKMEKPDILSGLADSSYDKKYNYIDDDANENISSDEINKIDNLVTRSNIHNIDSIIDAALASSCTDFGTILSPVALLNEDVDDKTMNTSKSSDAVLMNNERFIQLCDENNGMFLISPPSTPCTPKVNNQQLQQNLSVSSSPLNPGTLLNAQQQHQQLKQQESDIKSLTPTTNTFAASDASTISLDLVASPNNLLQPKCNLKPPSHSIGSSYLNNRQGNFNNHNLGVDNSNDVNRCINTVNGESVNGVQLQQTQQQHGIDLVEDNLKNGIDHDDSTTDDCGIDQIGSSLNSKKRQSSTVTYNVNVINFGEGDEPTKGPVRNSCGARSNSSTSKSNY